MDENNSKRAATFADLNAAEERLAANLNVAKERLAADLNAAEERLAERIDRIEISLLTEFHKWAQTYEIRSRGVTTLVHTFEERLGVLEERVSALERRRP